MLNRSSVNKTAINRADNQAFFLFAAFTVAATSYGAITGHGDVPASFDRHETSRGSVVLVTAANGAGDGGVASSGEVLLHGRYGADFASLTSASGILATSLNKNTGFEVFPLVSGNLLPVKTASGRWDGRTRAWGMLDPSVSGGGQSVVEIFLNGRAVSLAEVHLNLTHATTPEGVAHTSGQGLLQHLGVMKSHAGLVSSGNLNAGQIHRTDLLGCARSWSVFDGERSTPITFETSSSSLGEAYLSASRSIKAQAGGAGAWGGVNVHMIHAAQSHEGAAAFGDITLTGRFAFSLAGNAKTYSYVPTNVVRRVTYEGWAKSDGTLAGLQLNTERPAPKARTLVVN